MIKRTLCGLVLGASVLSLNAALAHTGDKPKHGGIVRAASELSFEMVPAADGATIYVEDHGKSLPTQGMSGKLTVLNGAQKSEADLKPAGDNKLVVQGVKLGKGSKAVATVNTAQKKAITVRFAIP